MFPLVVVIVAINAGQQKSMHYKWHMGIEGYNITRKHIPISRSFIVCVSLEMAGIHTCSICRYIKFIISYAYDIASFIWLHILILYIYVPIM